MKIEYLQYFVTLANASSISKAAEELYISQQQLSRIITILEEDINAKLITRSTQGFALTPEGKDFLKYAKNILGEYAAMKNHFYLRQNQQQFFSTPNTECRVYLAPCFSLYTNDIISSMKKIAPNIKLTIHDRTTGLNEGHYELDAISFWAMPFADDEFIKGDTQTFHIQEIGQCDNYLIYNQYQEQFNDVDETAANLVTAIYSHSLPYYNQERVMLVSGNVIQIVDSVAQNSAVCTLPDFTLPKIKPLYPDLGYKQVKNGICPFSVIYSTDHTLTEADKIVINFMKTYIQNLQMLSKQLL